ncbi:MAG: factor H binding family protein [Neisseria sp.]|nr:factor H binding family protein [Neisseria sp.]
MTPTTPTTGGNTGSNGSALNAVPAAYREQVRQTKIIQLDMEDEDAKYEATAFGKKYDVNNEIMDLSALPLGLHDYPYRAADSIKRSFQMGTGAYSYDLKAGDVYKENGIFRIYQQPYSIVRGTYVIDEQKNNERVNVWSDADIDAYFEANQILGLVTTKAAVDALNIQATYRGLAFTAKDQGELVYNVDFKNRSGSGEITGLDKFGRISLEKGNIAEIPKWLESDQTVTGITAAARAEKSDGLTSYTLMFAGPQAEEVAGVVADEIMQYKEDISYGVIGFGGKR